MSSERKVRKNKGRRPVNLSVSNLESNYANKEFLISDNESNSNGFNYEISFFIRGKFTFILFDVSSFVAALTRINLQETRSPTQHSKRESIAFKKLGLLSAKSIRAIGGTSIKF